MLWVASFLHQRAQHTWPQLFSRSVCLLSFILWPSQSDLTLKVVQGWKTLLSRKIFSSRRHALPLYQPLLSPSFSIFPESVCGKVWKISGMQSPFISLHSLLHASALMSYTLGVLNQPTTCIFWNKNLKLHCYLLCPSFRTVLIA